MDPIVVNFIIKMVQTSSKLIETRLKKEILSKINSKLDSVLAKQDQQILSQLKSAYDAISDAVNTTNQETIMKRLSYAENTLLLNTRLDLSLTTAGYSNAHWVALANYGLALICSFRTDETTQAIHILRMYEADPRYSRTQLEPKLYDEFFKPKCKNVLEWKKRRSEEINNLNFNGRVFLQKTAGVAVMAGAIVSGIFLGLSRQPVAGRVVIDSGLKSGGKIWDDADKNIPKYRLEALSSLQEEVELKLDECCKKIAQSFL